MLNTFGPLFCTFGLGWFAAEWETVVELESLLLYEKI